MDASGGRVRRFCAESTVRLPDGTRLTPTNAIQAGEMHYNEGGASPYHVHKGTPANPEGAAHCYMTFKGRGMVEVNNEFQEIDPGTLVYFPPGVPHRLRAHGGPLDYFEIQAWRSFKTTILSEEPLGLKWFYEREKPERRTRGVEPELNRCTSRSEFGTIDSPLLRIGGEAAHQEIAGFLKPARVHSNDDPGRAV